MTAMAESLSRADAAWLHMEEPTNHFVVTSLMLLEDRLELGRLREAMRRRLPALPRLSQRAVEIGWLLAAPRWEADPNFELDAHLHRVALPGAGGRGELEALLGDLLGQPLDLQRPPWQTYLIEDYAGGSAVITRLHHCLGDGAALVQMQLALTDARRDGWRAHRPPVHYPGLLRGNPMKSPAGSGSLTNSTHVRTSFSTLRRRLRSASGSNIGVPTSPMRALCRS